MHSAPLPTGAGVVAIPIVLLATSLGAKSLLAGLVLVRAACLIAVSWLDDMVKLPAAPRLLVHAAVVATCIFPAVAGAAGFSMACAITGKSVLVSGAEGSIGSELVREVLRRTSTTGFLLDSGENNLFAIDMKARRQLQAAATQNGQPPRVITVLGSVGLSGQAWSWQYGKGGAA